MWRILSLANKWMVLSLRSIWTSLPLLSKGCSQGPQLELAYGSRGGPGAARLVGEGHPARLGTIRSARAVKLLNSADYVYSLSFLSIGLQATPLEDELDSQGVLLETV